MIPGGEFRHYAAVLGMQSNLTVKRVRQQPAAVVVDGNSGFVAGSLNAEHAHDFAILHAGR